MELNEETHRRLNAYLERDIETLTLGELADFATLLESHKDAVEARISPNSSKQPKREYPRFV